MNNLKNSLDELKQFRKDLLDDEHIRHYVQVPSEETFNTAIDCIEIILDFYKLQEKYDD